MVLDPIVLIDDVDTELLRLLAAKAMNPKPGKKSDSFKRMMSKRNSSINGEIG